MIDLADMEIIKTTPATITLKGVQHKGELRLFQVEDPDTDHYNVLDWGTPDEVNLYYANYNSRVTQFGEDHILDGIVQAIQRKCKTSLAYTKKWLKFVQENFGDDENVCCKWEGADTKLISEVKRITLKKVREHGFQFAPYDRSGQDEMAEMILNGSDGFDHGFGVVYVSFDGYALNVTSRYKGCEQVFLWEIDPESVAPDARAEKVEEMTTYAKMFTDWASGRIEVIEADFYAKADCVTTRVTLRDAAMEHGYDMDTNLWGYQSLEENKKQVEDFNQQMIKLLVEKYEAVIG